MGTCTCSSLHGAPVICDLCIAHMYACTCTCMHRYGGAQGSDEVEDEPKKEEPNFGLSGKLTAETNSYRVCTCTCIFT